MLHYYRFSRIIGAVVATLLAAAPAAASAAARGEFAFELGAATEYVSKGVGKSMGEPHVFGSAQWSSGPAYVNVYATPVDMSQGSEGEILTSVGVKPEAGGFDFDFRAIHRLRPGTRAGVDSTFWEVQGDVSRKVGPVSGRLRVNYTTDGFAGTKEAWWIEGQATLKAAAKTKVSAALGVREAVGGADYTAWNVGVRQGLTRNIDVDLRWYGTSRADDLRGEYRPGLAASVIAKF